MPLLGNQKTCPIHGCELVLSHRGIKHIDDFPLIEVEGVPMLYCPECFKEGKDTSVEIETSATNTFLKKLKQLMERSSFPGQLSKPKIKVDFNPLKTALGNLNQSANPGSVHKQWRRTEKPDEETENERMDNFEPQQPKHSLDQLILEAETLQRIREAINVLISQDLIYDAWGLKTVARTGRRVALNFYGPPGTGKTLAADAIANILGKELLIISYAELESKYVGETPKNIQAAFKKASECGAVLFFDEADSILGKRLTNISQSADNSINVARSTTLIELDNFDGIVIFASNLVKNYDTAFLRRMLAHIEFKLPAKAEREKIWKCHIPPQLPLDKQVNFSALAQSSEGAAGGDIQNAVLLAASYASMRQEAEKVVKESDFQRAITFILDGKHKIIH
jgi:SpoVK/Ycf46/Vps4 family AAA+-type ATPase